MINLEKEIRQQPDVLSGIEEASSAMIEGRIAGVSVAHDFFFFFDEEFKEKVAGFETALGSLRQGMFAPENRGKKEGSETLP